jgi:hypothetical protein
MEYIVLLDADFEQWLREQEAGLRDSILAHALLLGKFGPALGRPQVDTLKGSKLPNLKELRVQYRGEPWQGKLKILLLPFHMKNRLLSGKKPSV